MTTTRPLSGVEARAVTLAMTLIASIAQAWPADVYVDSKAGEDKFQRLNAIEWTESENKDIAEVEPLPSGEALITGKRPGATLVLLYAEGKMGVWKVNVEASPDAGSKQKPPDVDEYVRARQADLLAAAKKACPDLKQNPGSSDEALVVTVKTDACRAALKALFQTDAFNARELSLTYDLPVLQTQLREMQAAIDASIGKGKVTAVYSGAGLRLSGKITVAEHRKVLWALFKNSVGRVALEDRLELIDQKPPPKEEDEKESP